MKCEKCQAEIQLATEEGHCFRCYRDAKDAEAEHPPVLALDLGAEDSVLFQKERELAIQGCDFNVWLGFLKQLYEKWEKEKAKMKPVQEEGEVTT